MLLDCPLFMKSILMLIILPLFHCIKYLQATGRHFTIFFFLVLSSTAFIPEKDSQENLKGFSTPPDFAFLQIQAPDFFTLGLWFPNVHNSEIHFFFSKALKHEFKSCARKESSSISCELRIC